MSTFSFFSFSSSSSSSFLSFLYFIHPLFHPLNLLFCCIKFQWCVKLNPTYKRCVYSKCVLYYYYNIYLLFYYYIHVEPTEPNNKVPFYIIGVLLVVIVIIIIIIIIVIILIYTRRRKKKVDITNGNKTLSINNYIIINYHTISNNLGTGKETINRCVYLMILYECVFILIIVLRNGVISIYG